MHTRTHMRTSTPSDDFRSGLDLLLLLLLCGTPLDNQHHRACASGCLPGCHQLRQKEHHQAWFVARHRFLLRPVSRPPQWGRPSPPCPRTAPYAPLRVPMPPQTTRPARSLLAAFALPLPLARRPPFLLSLSRCPLPLSSPCATRPDEVAREVYGATAPPRQAPHEGAVRLADGGSSLAAALGGGDASGSDGEGEGDGGKAGGGSGGALLGLGYGSDDGEDDDDGSNDQDRKGDGGRAGGGPAVANAANGKPGPAAAAAAVQAPQPAGGPASSASSAMQVQAAEANSSSRKSAVPPVVGVAPPETRAAAQVRGLRLWCGAVRARAWHGWGGCAGRGCSWLHPSTACVVRLRGWTGPM